jgi:hypothetical protein
MRFIQSNFLELVSNIELFGVSAESLHLLFPMKQVGVFENGRVAQTAGMPFPVSRVSDRPAGKAHFSRKALCRAASPRKTGLRPFTGKKNGYGG